MKKNLWVCVLTMLVSCTFAFAPNGFTAPAGEYAWQGTINSTIPVSVWFAIKDDLVVGELTYTKTGSNKPIRLIGKVNPDDGRLDLRERLPDGTVTGIIDGSIKKDTFEGTWTGPGKIKESGNNYERIDGKIFPVILKKSDDASKKYTWATGNAVGKYAYSYGKHQYRGMATIHAADDTSINVEIFSVTSAPSFNQAQLDAVDCPREGNAYLCDMEANCAVTVRIFDDFISVDQVKDRYCTGYFGMNAHVTGTYIKLAQ